MKVLYILPYDWGAMPQYTAEIANAVSNHAEVTVIGSKNINEEYFCQNINIIKCFDSLSFSMNNLKKIISLTTLRQFSTYQNIKIIEDIDPDIIHLTTPIFPPLAVYLILNKFDKKYPIIHTKHGIFSNSSLKEKILEEYILNSFEKRVKLQKIIVHTIKDKEALLNIKNVNEKNIDIIPHGAYSFFKVYGKKLQTEKNTVLFFGNIRKYKGLRYLIQAIPLVLKKVPELKVIIAGEGDISEFSSFLETEHKVFEIHNEFISDMLVSELFQRSELVVLPYSDMSGQSGVLNVALAFGKPAVASDLGGISDIVVNGITGYLVPPKDPEALAEAIINILTNPKIQQKMEINMEIKSRDLSWNNIAKNYINLYSSLAEK